MAVTDSARLERAREAVAGVVEEFDRACSRFRQDSELTAVNAAAGSPVKVSPLLIDSVDAALRAAMLTAGDVDPSVGEALIALGYDRDFASIAAEAPPAMSASAGGRAAPPRIAEPRSRHIAKVPGWRAIQVDRGAGTILLPRGVSLDLGATAKALAADRAAARASQRAACGVLVGLGGDIALAGPAPEDGSENSRHRRSSRGPRRSGAVDQVAIGRTRDVEYRGTAVEGARRAGPPSTGSHHWTSR